MPYYAPKSYKTAKKLSYKRSGPVYPRRPTASMQMQNPRIPRYPRFQPEMKTAFFKQEGINFNSMITSGSDLLQLVPNIAIGSGDGNRIGRRIRPVSMVVRGYLSWDASFTTAFGPVEASLFAIRTKRTDNAVNLTNSDTYFLDEGGVGVQYDGTITRSLLPVLSENYEQLNRLDVKISGVGSSTQVDQEQILYKKFTFKIPVRGDWHYDGSQTYPDNWNGFLTAGFTNPRVIVQGDGTYAPLKLSYSVVLKYFD